MSTSSYAPPPAQASVMNSETWARLYLSTASHRERFCAFAYNWSFLVTCGLQLSVIVAFLIFDPNTLRTGYAMNATMSVLLILFQLVQLVFIVAAHVGMLKELVALYVRPTKIWNIYMTSLLCFAALYFTCFAYDRSSFNVDGYAPSGNPDSADPTQADQDVQTYNDVPTIFLFFCYFSGAIMTSTGFGDIAPAVAYTQFFSNLQMLLGCVYHVGVFGLTLAHFRTFQKMSQEEKAKREGDPSLLSSVMSLVDQLQLARRIRAIHPNLDRFRRFCVHHLAIFSIVFETLVTLLLFAIPGNPFDTLTPADGSRYSIKIAIIVLMVLLQFGLFVTVLLISLRLVKSINSKDLSANFLVQSYIATALLFGGIYFILFAATAHPPVQSADRLLHLHLLRPLHLCTLLPHRDDHHWLRGYLCARCHRPHVRAHPDARLHPVQRRHHRPRHQSADRHAECEGGGGVQCYATEGRGECHCQCARLADGRGRGRGGAVGGR